MTDIVERLLTTRDCTVCDGDGTKSNGRLCGGCDGAGKVLSYGSTGKEAADEIERLRSLATQDHQGGGPQVYTKEASNYNLPSEVIVPDSLFTALSQQPLSVPAWQPIETAPKDGTVIFVWAHGYEWPEAVLYEDYSDQAREEIGEDGFWRYAETTMAEICTDCGSETWTHWQNLPAAPAHPTQSDVSCSRAREGGTE